MYWLHTTYLYLLNAVKCNGETKTKESSCCTMDFPCQLGEGDCDVDADCAGHLTCGTDNCDTKFRSTSDCCQGK